MNRVPGRAPGGLATGAFVSLAELLLGDGPRAPEGLAWDRLAASFARYLDGLPWHMRLGLGWGLRALELSPLVLRGHRFSRLSAGARARFLTSLERTRCYPVRAATLGLKSAIVMVCFDDVAVERAIGYEHRCLLVDRAGPLPGRPAEAAGDSGEHRPAR